MSNKHSEESAIAVVGVSALYPGSEDGQSFWNNILEGHDFMSDVPAEHWLVEDYYAPEPATPGKTYARRGGFLPAVPFDPLHYGLPPNQLSSTDTAQLLSLIVAEKVLDDAVSFQFEKVDRRDVSVILGMTSATELVGQMAARIQRPHWVKALRDAGLPEGQVGEICDRIEATYPEWNESTFPGLLGNVVAGRIANRLNLGGTNCVIDAACASSLGAVAMAVQELELAHSDLVITGGVDTLNDIFMYMCFSQTPALSPTGDCRPFSDAADGTMLGEGIGMVALRRLADAERDGDRIYGVIRGIGSSSDGRAKSIYAPRPEGQEIALRRAYERAGYGPGEVELVEAHGTATKAGDAAEFDGLCRAFATAERQDRQWCALGSIKSQIGHTKAAAGAASLFKVVMALHQKVLPPTIKVERPSEQLDFADSPFYLNTRARPWIKPAGRTRKGSVSSFGFGGSNFHLTLEEYAGPAAPPPRFASMPAHLVLLGAADVRGLSDALGRAVERLERGAALPALARESQLAFSPAEARRLAVMGRDADELRSVAKIIRKHLAEKPEQALSMPGRVHYLPGSAEAAAGDIAFLFPGQGSQYLNMGAEVAMALSDARSVWDETADLWEGTDGALHDVVFPRPAFSEDARRVQEERLTSTDRAQPAIGTVSLALLRVLTRAGLEPRAVGGHSYGEISALFAAGAICSPRDMLAISRERGALMKSTSRKPGAMLAVQAGEETVTELLEDASLAGLTLANVNSPRQTVVAGEPAAIERLADVLHEREIRCRTLPVATAFHTEWVAGSAEPLEAFLHDCDLGTPEIPVYSNTDGEPYAGDADGIRAQLAGQLARPVRFARMIERMHEDGCRVFLEVGPGSTLSGMVGDCLENRPHHAIATDQKGQDGRASLINALATLSALGIPIDYEALWSEFAPFSSDEDKPELSAATVRLSGSNYGKLYPPVEGAAGRPAPNPEPTQKHQPMTAPSDHDPAQPSAPEKAAFPGGPPEDSATPSASAAPTPEWAAAAPSASAVPTPEWAAAFAEIQRNALQAQQAFTAALSESHKAYLRATETAFAQLGQLSGAPSTHRPAPATEVLPAAPPQPRSPPQPPAPTPATNGATNGAAAHAAPIPAAPDAAAQSQPAPQPPPAAPPAASAAPAAIDYEALLYEVVADKTGYPIEMLTADMELESGLGIDSIKRVEILSVLQKKVPELASVDAAELGALGTLGEIVAYAQKVTGQGAAKAAATPAADEEAPVTQAAGQPAATTDYEALLYEVVADKTGYPTEMLSADMELESGLGIDSIKRVEILSVLQKKVPELASVDAAELGALGTLGEIVAYARKVTGQGAAPEKKNAEPDAAPAGASLNRRVIDVRDRPAPGIVTPGLQKADPLFIVAPPAQEGIARRLAERLDQADVKAQVVAEVPTDAEALVLMTGLGVTDARTAAERNEVVFAELKRCAERMAQAGKLLVTVQDTGGDFGIGGGGGAKVWATGIAAAAKTAALEWPGVEVKAIDVAARALGEGGTTERLYQELLAGGSAREVGLTPDGRFTPVLVSDTSGPTAQPDFAPDDVIVVSGGARGVTTSCLLALMERVPARLALFGRTAPQAEPEAQKAFGTDAELKRYLLQQHRDRGEAITPVELGQNVQKILSQREVQANLERLRATGATVRYYTVDISDPDQVAATLEQVRTELGPIRGLVHAAGVLADKPIAGKSAEQFRQVFRTKVDGLRNLLDATEVDPLHHIICFSSVAARTGNAGQVDYAMANEVLGRVCRREAVRRGRACAVKVIGWGPWAGGMVDDALRHHFDQMGVELIPLDRGARFFADEVTGRHGEAVEIVVGGGLENFSAAPVAKRAGEGTTTHHVRFQRALFPYIGSHVIRGRPVVPVVTVINLACEAAQALYPDSRVNSCSGVQVKKGIRLDAFDGRGDSFQLRCRPHASENAVFVEVTDLSGTVYYTLDVHFDHPPPDARSPSSADAELEPWRPASGQVYDGRLFHGPDLHSITALEGISGQGAVGVVEHQNPDCRGLLPPLDVLDGGMQIAVLWVHEQGGTESLPTSIDRFWFDPDWPLSGPVRCEAWCTERTSLKSEWRLRFFDSKSRLLGATDGVHLHHLPEEQSRDARHGEIARA